MAYEDPLVIEASSAKTTTGNGSVQRAGNAANVTVLLDCTAASGTTPTLDLKVQWAMDGATFVDPETADSFTQVTAAGKKVKTFPVRAPAYRLAWTIGGTSPSFTFSATRYLTG